MVRTSEGVRNAYSPRGDDEPPFGSACATVDGTGFVVRGERYGVHQRCWEFVTAREDQLRPGRFYVPDDSADGRRYITGGFQGGYDPNKPGGVWREVPANGYGGQDLVPK